MYTKNTHQNNKWMKIILVDSLILCVVLILIGILHYVAAPKVEIDGIYLNQPQDMADFYLIDHNGKPLTKNQLKGHWTLLFFGFTHCESVCPMTFDVLNKMYILLQTKLAANLLPRIVFISIDPEKDTVMRLRQYVSAYNTHFLGARATLKKTLAIEKQFSIPVSNQNGVINHSTDILLLNPAVQIQAYFLYPHRPTNLARDYQLILQQVR